MSEITIILNGENKTLPGEMTIDGLVEFFELDRQKIAIEKDLEIVNPDDFDKITLKDGAKLEIVHFIGGG